MRTGYSPANNQSMDSIFILNLVLSWSTQRIHGNTIFIPEESTQRYTTLHNTTLHNRILHDTTTVLNTALHSITAYSTIQHYVTLHKSTLDKINTGAVTHVGTLRERDRITGW